MPDPASRRQPVTSFVEADTLPVAARRHPLVAEVRRRLTRYVGVIDQPRMMVAVSGGADSVALLVALLAIRSQKSSLVHPQPIIAHVNHHLRDDADVDASFVRSLGERFSVPVVVKDVHPRAAGGNLAAAARQMRYAALAKAAREHDAAYVAVAHHAEDQIESMLMALCRGTGLDGLGAMAWSRPLGDEGIDDRVDGKKAVAISLVRPLLGSRKSDCEALCAAAGIVWREDSSNRDLARTRNRLRHEVLPILESCWPDAMVRATLTAELLQEAERLLEAKLGQQFGPAEQCEWSRDALRELSPVLIAAGLRRAATTLLMTRCDHSGESLDDALTQRVLLPAAEAIADDDSSPREFSLGNDLTLEVRSRSVLLRGNT